MGAQSRRGRRREGERKGDRATTRGILGENKMERENGGAMEMRRDVISGVVLWDSIEMVDTRERGVKTDGHGSVWFVIAVPTEALLEATAAC